MDCILQSVEILYIYNAFKTSSIIIMTYLVILRLDCVIEVFLWDIFRVELYLFVFFFTMLTCSAFVRWVQLQSRVAQMAKYGLFMFLYVIVPFLLLPYFSIDNAHLMYNAHPKFFDIFFMYR
jgi:hypothetical protein